MWGTRGQRQALWQTPSPRVECRVCQDRRPQAAMHGRVEGQVLVAPRARLAHGQTRG